MEVLLLSLLSSLVLDNDVESNKLDDDDEDSCCSCCSLSSRTFVDPPTIEGSKEDGDDEDIDEAEIQHPKQTIRTRTVLIRLNKNNISMFGDDVPMQSGSMYR